jgi:hypothetical protein
MNKLHIFKQNDVKSFKFNTEQYINLEIEYNRYIVYKELVKHIENVFKLNEFANEYSNRKIYENKNIIDRFILECINHGISPKLNNIIEKKLDNNAENNLDAKLCSNNINITDSRIDNLNDVEYIDALNGMLFFNKNINTIENLRKCVYFKKMINEYNEKKIKITSERILKLERTIIEAQSKFININRILMLNRNKASAFQNIACSIFVSGEDNYIIKYRTYTKVINFKRYAKLIHNYDRPFPYDIIRMILRYSIFDTSNQQWSIGIKLYDNISNLFDIGFEMFASPLNFNMNMFCSIFLDTDKIFGSVGSFYNLSIDRLLNQNIKGVFFNPPYLPILMDYTTKICINLLEKMELENIDFTVISFLPNWADADYIQLFLQSKYLITYKIVSKGDYILHEKDKGKLIKGTFELLVIIMNSKKNKWDMEKMDNVNKNFKDIIKLMKDETYLGNIEE